MRFRWAIGLLCLTLPLFIVQFTKANAAPHVNESATRVLFKEREAEVWLMVANPTGSDLSARVRVELLDPEGQVRGFSERDETIKRGEGRVRLSLPFKFSDLGNDERDRVLWYRLRYRITAVQRDELPSDGLRGIVSLSEVTPDFFNLRVMSPRMTREGARYRAHVRTVHPASGRPVSNVQVDGTIEFDDDEDAAPSNVSGVTGADGYVALEFNLPQRLKSTSPNLKVTARNGVMKKEAEESFEIDNKSRMLINTDKPIYQPGQMLHVRALFLSPSRRAIPDTETTLTIEDPEGITAFSAPLKTSRFGIASGSWAIPENARLGEYEVTFSREDESRATLRVKISRYDLPNFTVNTKPDRGYYLPGQNAEVEVRADYLFGQPLTRGNVRLVRETEREWNYREQKYDIKEGDKYEGKLENGRFVARISLDAEHEELKKSDYLRFRDLTYAAYVTDPTTNRTEQRRFTMRVTKDAIHVYVITDAYEHNPKHPLRFYVSTYYADGTPAQTSVAISDANPPTIASSTSDRTPGLRPLASVETNRYGLAKIDGLMLPPVESGQSSSNIHFAARDAQGAAGSHTESFSLTDKLVIRVETNKTIYRAGEPVEVRIDSSEPELMVNVDAVSDMQVVRSRTVRLKDGKASLALPYSKEFKDELTVMAYTDFYERESYGSRRVIYPRNRELQLDVQPAQQTYRPGEEAQLAFNVRSPQGQSVESVLGVVVLDRAVEERALTAQEFGSRSFDASYVFRNLLGYYDGISGVTLRDLDKLDTSKPIPEDLALVAEVLLSSHNRYAYYPQFFDTDSYDHSALVFSSLISKLLRPVADALEARYKAKVEYPHEEASLRRILAESGVNLDDLRDPWDRPYRVAFTVEDQNDELAFLSAGPDKLFGTADDLTALRQLRPYFRLSGETIDRTVIAFHERTGDFIKDEATLRSESLRAGLNLDTVRDKWGQPYKFTLSVNRSEYVWTVTSGGPNKAFEPEGRASSDDFAVWMNHIDYFKEQRESISKALNHGLPANSAFPRDAAQLRATLQRNGIDFDSLRDPFGRPYYVIFPQSSQRSDRLSIQASYDNQNNRRTVVIPVTQSIHHINIRSAGADGAEGTADDFDVATYASAVSEEAGVNSKFKPAAGQQVFTGLTGAISGTVLDPTGASISGAIARATNTFISQVYETTTDDEGKFILRNLPPGVYQLQVESPGFMMMTLTDVRVRSSSVTEVSVTLSVAAATETVEVSAAAISHLETSTMNRSISHLRGSVKVVTRSGANEDPHTPQSQISTPRLREHFPETLVWQPSLETDAQGRAKLNFKLADNITTWKVAVIGSTAEGDIGLTEQEIRAFQPFFVEHDPPRVLTEGDEISLPVVLRNYLDRAQSVNLEMKPETWFALLGPARKRAEVAAGDASRETFDLRAVASVKEGKQRVTAMGSDESDAIEKPVSVHPHGEEKVVTASDIIRDTVTLDASIPADAIRGSISGEVKFYPNLLSHVVEGIEGILQRPYGCGEQTVSSTYPNLIVLRFYKRTGSGDSPVAGKAMRYLQAGYERLLNYRTPDGGFSYWGRGDADLALTAYALRFLNDAREFVEVDEMVVKGAHQWLIKQQRSDGSWPAHNWDKSEDRQRTTILTSYVARVLASTHRNSGTAATSATPPELKRALTLLSARINEIDEPYLIASYALAAFDAGEAAQAQTALEKLRTLAREENGTNYWSLETNTPFYGWGLTGRIETTALAVQALARRSETATGRDTTLVNRGLLFLLRQKDRYGVWYSTQATVNVFDALVMLTQPSATAVGGVSQTATRLKTGETVELFVNGQLATSFMLSGGDRSYSPVSVNVSDFIKSGANSITLRRAAGSSPATAQLVTSYYVPWAASSAAVNSEGTRVKDGGDLRLALSFDKTQAGINEDITCNVKAERVGFRGYGMLLAEIGLPPGADVDRASLETAMKGSGWSLSQYDVLPDRLVVYLWPRAGGTSFSFKFRPRFGLNAQTAPSVVYDYYNPEAKAVIAPSKFVVR